MKYSDNNMNKIAVNPTQFITCRLCLEELGNYQIVPSVKDQIAFCFDIKVEPFDGLPQLICQKCEEILSTFSKVKETFIKKQNELLTKISNTQKSHGNLSDAQKREEESIYAKRKPSSSSNDLVIKPKVKIIERNNHTKEQNDDSWQDNYLKQFVCKLCNSHLSSIKSWKKHSKRHNYLYKKYGNILKRHCHVQLYKYDEKSNLTGSASSVVLEKDKIVKSINAGYSIVYTIKSDKSNKNHRKKGEDTVKNRLRSSSESSEDIIVKRKRIRRISSRSSNDTFILDTKSDHSDIGDREFPKSETVEPLAACIDIDDTSEAESEKSIASKAAPGLKLSNSIGSKVDPSTISEIITMCTNKYIKKHYQDTNKNNSDIASKLQHKMLSIGRKTINKRIGVNCTPILRFLEHKNLDIAWLSRDLPSVTQDSNHIRIIPRRKNKAEKIEDNETGWTDYTSSQTTFAMNTSNKSEREHKKSKAYNGIEMFEDLPVTLADATVTSDSNLGSLEIRKLLNANPVANPKQLPKKHASSEMKTSKMALQTSECIPQEDNSPELCMPIITSTTSLAALFSVSDDSNDPKRTEIHSTIDKQSDAPRIKVKPVSELMSTETLNRMQNSIQLCVQSPMQPPIQSSMQSLVESPIQPPVQTSMQSLIHNSLRPPLQTSMQSLIQSPMQPPVKTSMQSLIQSTVQPTTQTSMQSLTQSPLQPTIQTSMQSLIQSSMQPHVQTSMQSLIQSSMQSPISSPTQQTIQISMQPPQNPMQQTIQSPIHIPVNIVGKGLPLAIQNVTVPSISMPVIVSSQSLLQSNNDITNVLRIEPSSQDDYIILDTVDMPNMKTNSPYLYVKKLLLMHNIIMLDAHVELPKDFHCLIKFKVLYKQDFNNQPVTLCLSLFCSKNVFCFKVRNRNNEIIDITKLACNWQWEVLKIFKGEVVNKLLLNAQKIGQEMYNFTNSFLCLLKSINVIPKS